MIRAATMILHKEIRARGSRTRCIGWPAYFGPSFVQGGSGESRTDCRVFFRVLSAPVPPADLQSPDPRLERWFRQLEGLRRVA